jgi:hypothetical protein
MKGKSMKNNDFLKRLYKCNPINGNYIIEVALEKYSDVFNGWDNAPFEKKDLNPSLQSFLESSSSHIPYKYNIDLYFYAPKEIQDKAKEKQITSEIRSHYCFCLDNQRKILYHSYKRTVCYAIASFTILFIGFFSEKLLHDDVFDRIIFEGLNIGGWVFLWEALSFFFFKKGRISYKIKECKRFLNCSIYFKYKNK